jgi:copper oxidase (laccase) domain-containing protein
MGIEHGFFGKCYSLLPDSFVVDVQSLRSELRVEELFFLQQVHGNEIVELPAGDASDPYSAARWNAEDEYLTFPAGDAFFIPHTEPTVGERKERQGSRCAFTIRTADCAPVILHSDAGVAVVHAGWRGVVAQIVPEAIKRVSTNEQSRVICVVGPLAGGGQYEVGEEVIVALGDDAVYTPSTAKSPAGANQDKFFLSIAETIHNQARRLVPEKFLEFYSSEVCTMTCSSYHSYRIDGLSAGRNLSFVIVER